MSVLQAFFALVALAALAGCLVAWRRWRAEQQELARVRATFARYVAPSVVDVLLARKDERLFTGSAVRATVLVCRIRDFAHFIEPLSPEQALRYLNEFYALTGTAIQRRRGIIQTFLGDGIVGVFGVPLENPTQEDDALQAALDIVRHVVTMRKRWAQQHRKPLTVGIGVNTGEVIAGDAGFRDRREFTVVGSEAIFAYRLQEAAFALNAFVVASRATCESLASEYKLVPVSGVPLPGVRRLLDAYVVRARLHGTESSGVPDDVMVETTIVPPDAPAGSPETAPAQTAAAQKPAAHGAPAQQPAPQQPPLARPAAPRNQPAPPRQPAASPQTAIAAPPQSPPLPQPPPSPQELPPARPMPRPAARTAAAELGLPDLGDDGWPSIHDGPIFPDPPPPRATYEDRGGSFQL
ncbi:MAG TPA: adenylate/guanylate cyclase domain-containing protein [Candidatus Elarobacter sp.]|jgi:class 3 adenylate cyclase|nr:adenylate/guanylate cyclase domain-containing protein [Candidatus Elarobacter sp.]